MTRSIFLSALLILSASAASADNTCHLLNRSITAAKAQLERAYTSHDAFVRNPGSVPTSAILSTLKGHKANVRRYVDELSTAVATSAQLGCSAAPVAAAPVAAAPVAAAEPVADTYTPQPVELNIEQPRVSLVPCSVTPEASLVPWDYSNCLGE
jgi:hypothetical protein